MPSEILTEGARVRVVLPADAGNEYLNGKTGTVVQSDGRFRRVELEHVEHRLAAMVSLPVEWLRAAPHPDWVQPDGTVPAPIGYCRECGSRRIQWPCWVGVNDGTVLEPYGFDDEYWCEGCEDYGAGINWGDRRAAAEARLHARAAREAAQNG